MRPTISKSKVALTVENGLKLSPMVKPKAVLTEKLVQSSLATTQIKKDTWQTAHVKAIANQNSQLKLSVQIEERTGKPLKRKKKVSSKDCTQGQRWQKLKSVRTNVNRKKEA